MTREEKLAEIRKIASWESLETSTVSGARKVEENVKNYLGVPDNTSQSDQSMIFEWAEKLRQMFPTLFPSGTKDSDLSVRMATAYYRRYIWRQNKPMDPETVFHLMVEQCRGIYELQQMDFFNEMDYDEYSKYFTTIPQDDHNYFTNFEKDWDPDWGDDDD